jgi:hypothetical protein
MLLTIMNGLFISLALQQNVGIILLYTCMPLPPDCKSLGQQAQSLHDYLSTPFGSIQIVSETEAYVLKFLCLFTGGVGACGYSDYSVNPPQRDNPECTNFAVI